MRCHFFQWIDGPEMYDRAFIQQKYMLNYSMRAENFRAVETLRTGPC